MLTVWVSSGGCWLRRSDLHACRYYARTAAQAFLERSERADAVAIDPIVLETVHNHFDLQACIIHGNGRG
jgi:hypothetical protein